MEMNLLCFVVPFNLVLKNKVKPDKMNIFMVNGYIFREVILSKLFVSLLERGLL